MSDALLNNEPATLTRPDKLEQTLVWFFWGSLAVFLFCYAIRPIFDPDFWWHLKTGEVMLQNKGLLQSDPFNFTGDGVVSSREALILKGYWLWQIIAYGLYSFFGFHGISLLNLATVGGMFWAVVHQMRWLRVSPALAIPLITLGFYLLSVTYPLERPQVVSFLFATLLLGLLARVRDGGRFGWALPLVMMLWANLHGGFVVGDLILLCFAAGTVIEYRQDLPRMRHILFWVAVGIGASLLNPNGGLAFVEIFSFHNSALMKGVPEYQSTWVKFHNGSRFVAILWLFIALYGIGVWNSRRLYLSELFVALFLAYISIMYIRNIGFFSLALLPVIGGHLQQGAPRLQRRLTSLISPALLFCTAFLLWNSYNLWQEHLEGGAVKSIYPENAITFLHESGLQGRMFNSYEYGGYLLWRLSPQMQIFIDGRGLEPKVFDDYHKLSSASMTWVEGRREFETLLDTYAIDYIIQPIYQGDGSVQPLMKALLHQPDFIPIYLDTNVYILARLNNLNYEAINTFHIDKNEFKTRLLIIYNYISQSYPHEVGYKVAKAGMMLYMGMYEEAKLQVTEIADIAPNDQALSVLRLELAALSAKRSRL